MPPLRKFRQTSNRTTAIVFAIISLGPLALLTFSSMTFAERAVRDEALSRVRTTASVSSSLVQREMQSVTELVDSFATRPTLVSSTSTRDPQAFDLDMVDFHVGELLSSRSGIVGAFLADTSCRVQSVRPESPEVIGKSFAYRDWCKGVRASGAPYVSEAYRTKIAGQPLVVAAVVPVRATDDDGTGVPLAYLAAIFDLNEIQHFAAELAGAQGIDLTVVDNRGTVLADPTLGSAGTELHARRSDPLLADAFGGRSGVTETSVDGERALVAFAPVTDLGWVVTAEVPTREAFAGVSEMRHSVLQLAGILAVVLIAGVCLLLRMLHLRKLAETAVRDVEIRTRDILDQASDGFIAMNEDGCVTGWNTAACELFGWSSQEAIGRRLSDLILPAEQRGIYWPRLQQFLRSGEGPVVGNRVEIDTVDRSGRIFPVELAVQAARVNDTWTFSAFVHDISARKLRESELAKVRDQALEASRLKSEFLANMSHEIRTPMNGVLGMTSLLLDTDLDPAQRDSAETVLRSGESLLEIIDDILDFSKIEAGRFDVETVDFYLAHLIEDVTGLLSVPAAEKGLTLTLHVDPNVPTSVAGDPGRVRQILTNLVGNAIKFTDSGDVMVKVSLDEQPPTSTTPKPECTLRFEVTDTGIGIDVDQQAMIFESFTQADPSTTRRFGGTGLGLAISKQLVTLMGGEIGVRSATGTGSTFWFTLPVTVAVPLARRPRRNDLNGARVLVVDDNAMNRALLSRTLESWGVDHQDAPDASSALHSLREAVASGQPFDAALIDFHMPGVDGPTLASLIIADPTIASVALILLTSSAQRGEAGLAEAAGIAGFLTKPVHPVQLRACLATVLGSGAAAPGQMPIVTRHGLAEVALRGGTVLLAEDNPVNQRVAFGMLHALGYQVEVVSNGRAAVAAAAARQFDAILMDCQMPEMDGYSATRLIRAAEGATRHTPIVAVTGSALQQDRQRCLDAGMDEHLAKPVRRDELAVLLEQLVHGGQPDHVTAAHQRTDDTQDPVVDLQSSIRARLDELFEGLDGDIEADSADLLQSFLRRAGDEIDVVTEALAMKDEQRVRQSAHSLKGMAANVGVTTVAMLAGELEDAARDGHLPTVGSVSGDLRVALEAAETTIDAMVPPLAARA